MFERQMRNGRIRENNKWAQKFQVEQLDKSLFFHLTWATVTALYEGLHLETSENLYKNDYGELYFAKITKEKCVAIVNANNKVLTPTFNYDMLTDKSLPFTDLSRLQLEPTPINSRYYKLFDLHEHGAHLTKKRKSENITVGNAGQKIDIKQNLCKGGGSSSRAAKDKRKRQKEQYESRKVSDNKGSDGKLFPY